MVLDRVVLPLTMPPNRDALQVVRTSQIAMAPLWRRSRAVAGLDLNAGRERQMRAAYDPGHSAQSPFAVSALVFGEY